MESSGDIQESPIASPLKLHLMSPAFTAWEIEEIHNGAQLFLKMPKMANIVDPEAAANLVPYCFPCSL